ncbi:MAG: aldehyde dehydrogenase family protein [Actinobacteria bacterium]|nr:aldehyde dehydrogenase family protein [Actinomycetota bacterium]
MLIGGEVVQAESGEFFESRCPANARFLANVPFAQGADVAHAVEAARTVAPLWRRTSLVERAARVREMASILQANAEILGIIDSVDSGNPVHAMIGDVGLAVEMLEYIAGIAMEVKGQSLPSMNDEWLMTRREPYGVVGRIIPFNHPLMFASARIGAPLVTGNAVVLKVPEQAPLAPLFMANLLKDVFPPGVLNVISGDGPITGDALVRHPDVKRIALIGSIETGRRIQASAAESAVKHVTLEMGGKNPMIIFPDADVERAAASAVFGMNFHYTAGQSCGSTSRLFVHETIHDAVLERILETVGKFRIGHPLDLRTQMGCLASEDQYKKATGYIELGQQEGAKLVQGGGRPEGEDFIEYPDLANGFYVEPTVFADVEMDMRIAREEIFGPVLSVFKWDDKGQVIQQANDVQYGLTASVWTNDLKQAFQTADAMDAGYVWINGSGTHYLGAPFGGHKNSGVDVEEGIEELYSYTQSKTVSVGF